ncbi:MAG: PH domain-containing protein [Chlorobi bacterium]|nr:MAG: Bacterial membrane flanked domain protein [Chlorobi bacterium OLB7]MBK8911161.1 PH domain-containing protein [Chlorobiota bacterium]
MVEFLKRLFFPLLKVELGQPNPPAGYDPHEFLRVERAAPEYLRYRLFGWMATSALLLVGLIAGTIATTIAVPALWWIDIPLALLAVAKISILYIATRIEYDVRWYIITDRSLLIREGVWTLREITLTFANAQNVRVTQGPLQRWFGFANIQIDTAGGGGKTQEGQAVPHRAVLRGIKNPEELRDLILELLRRHRTAGLGDPDDGHRHHHAPPALESARSKALLAEILEEVKGVGQAGILPEKGVLPGK